MTNIADQSFEKLMTYLSIASTHLTIEISKNRYDDALHKLRNELTDLMRELYDSKKNEQVVQDNI
jgi:hypothetical protein